MLLDNRRIGSCQSTFTDALGMKRVAAKIVPKFAKFWAKTRSHGHSSGDVDDVQRRSRFTQKGHNCWWIMGVCLWHWNQSPIIPMEASRRAKTKKHNKFGQIWRFCSLFSSIAIINSGHKVVRWIRNTTLSYASIARSNSSETHRIVQKTIMNFWPKTKP